MSIIGNPIQNCKVLLFCDSDFAGDHLTSKSTTGIFMALVGPQTFAPLAAISKGQSSVSHSSTESEIIALEYGLRTEGLPALDFWDAIFAAGCTSYHRAIARGDLLALLRQGKRKRRLGVTSAALRRRRKRNARGNDKNAAG